LPATKRPRGNMGGHTRRKKKYYIILLIYM
jgi:hypothetical protein